MIKYADDENKHNWKILNLKRKRRRGHVKLGKHLVYLWKIYIYYKLIYCDSYKQVWTTESRGGRSL